VTAADPWLSLDCPFSEVRFAPQQSSSCFPVADTRPMWCRSAQFVGIGLSAREISAGISAIRSHCDAVLYLCRSKWRLTCAGRNGAWPVTPSPILPAEEASWASGPSASPASGTRKSAMASRTRLMVAAPSVVWSQIRRRLACAFAGSVIHPDLFVDLRHVYLGVAANLQVVIEAERRPRRSAAARHCFPGRHGRPRPDDHDAVRLGAAVDGLTVGVHDARAARAVVVIVRAGRSAAPTAAALRVVRRATPA